MSITTSREERAAAVASLQALPDEQLRADLAYWAVRTGDHQLELERIRDRALVTRGLHEDAQSWVSLITEELMERRDRARSAERSTTTEEDR